MALRRILQDEELVKGFWHRGYQELTEHAGAGASQWVGRRILTAIVVAAVTAGIAYLVRTGSLK
jgi:cytochrome c-type biogenesis protein CcmH/NrfG